MVIITWSFQQEESFVLLELQARMIVLSEEFMCHSNDMLLPSEKKSCVVNIFTFTITNLLFLELYRLGRKSSEPKMVQASLSLSRAQYQLCSSYMDGFLFSTKIHQQR